MAVKLSNSRQMDPDHCSPILRGTCTVHVSYRAKIIQNALGNYCGEYANYKGNIDLFYPNAVYDVLEL